MGLLGREPMTGYALSNVTGIPARQHPWRGLIRHQARHLAVVSDSMDVVWAIAEDGSNWQSLSGPVPRRQTRRSRTSQAQAPGLTRAHQTCGPPTHPTPVNGTCPRIALPSIKVGLNPGAIAITP